LVSSIDCLGASAVMMLREHLPDRAFAGNHFDRHPDVPGFTAAVHD
jgi:hypothetical protein